LLGKYRAELDSADNDAVHVAVALSYGGRQDLVQAARAVAEAAASGALKPADVTESLIEGLLQSRSACSHGPPDLLIRCASATLLEHCCGIHAASAGD
jgi:undecaprenyl diphosphate synthase